MSYIALYRKWRPLVFEDVVEQEHVVKTLKYSISTERIAHAYLFCGTRGTGKTTLAKIFSRAINCTNPKEGDPCNECEICRGVLDGSILDVVEIDAASNNSVDNVREIREEVVYAPSQARYKVYIIDEVHMLSTGAFNALLKTLEEPPKHVVFILATTEPHKLPVTILSRCQRFDFRRITVDSIMDRISSIAEKSGTAVQKEAARLIARMADGALRDAISILDQCISLGREEVTYNDVLSVVGIVNDTFIAQIVDEISSNDVPDILILIEGLIMEGKDVTQFVSDLVHYYRNLLICKVADKPEEIIEASAETFERMNRQQSAIEKDEIIYIIKELSSLEASLKWSAHPRILLEVALIKLCERKDKIDRGDIERRLSLLEDKVGSGIYVPSKTSDNSKSPSESVHVSADSKKEGQKREAQTSKKTDTYASGDIRQVKGSMPRVKELDCWKDVLNELKGFGRMAVYTNLLDTKAVELDDRFVGIVFGEGAGFKKMLVSRAENLEAIEGIVSAKLGREVKVRCVDEGSINAAKEEEVDELVQKAQNMAKRFNAPLNIIDE